MQIIWLSLHALYYLQLRRFLLLIGRWWYPVRGFGYMVPNAPTVYYKFFMVEPHVLDARRSLLCIYAGGVIKIALESSTVVTSERWSSIDDYFKVVSKN